MGLSIRTTPAEISIQSTPASLNAHTVYAKLELEQKPPLINIKTEQARILIDQYPCFAEEGLKNNVDFIKEQAQKGLQKAISYTGKIARNGDEMAKIGYHANIMINIAKNEAITKHEFGLGYIPKSRPRISSTGGTLDLKAEFRNNLGEINGVTGNYTPGKISYNYTPARVDISVVSYGSIDIRYTGNDVDAYI
ncbi:hypothetical protein LY28_00937 [Ruminiclostridium sufflavum DSM 19573]|uniref:Uncharacterized protein n=1 Tax=Ruminiclostridium sufflavum DSM 19573 TaxID=1121337 RepID=A0A318XRN4_9FIRM|nr:DUF6470 family protein [Ruminiclostridium sufflavum]PYG89114.1 hypothetical protein LY28_00937 [Ruminiclostridium sufflavum DSM 19573]